MYVKRNQSLKEKKAFVQFFEFFHSGGLVHPIQRALIAMAKMVEYDRHALLENSLTVTLLFITRIPHTLHVQT